MKNDRTRETGILSWSAEDRPREKLLLKGRSSLSDAELLAIMLRSGTRDSSAVEVAKQLLSQADYDLNRLAELSIKQLSEPKGIGEAKAITIAAALELGRRRKERSRQKQPSVTSSRDAYDYLYPYMADLSHEQFFVLLMRRNNTIIRHVQVSAGGVSGTLVDPKLVFNPALEHLASAVIISHNHPSGNLKPSQADISLTRKLKDGGDLLEIRVLDHLIFTNHAYFSFADEGLM